MADFEGADRWLHVVTGWLGRRTQGSLGTSKWLADPGLRVERERYGRVLTAAVKKRDRAAGLPARSITRGRDRVRARS